GWNKRWCVLRSQALLIYKHFNEDKLKRIIRADEIADVHRVERRNHSFTFEVETPERTFFFEASSEQELDTWINRLRAVVASASAAAVSSDAYAAGTTSCTSTRTSAESRADSHRPNSAGSNSHVQFATTSRAAALSSSIRDVVPDAFMSLPSVSGSSRSQQQQPMRPANPIFPPQGGDSSVKSDQQLAEEASEGGRSLYASMPNALGLRIETANNDVVRKHSLQIMQSPIANTMTALPPEIDAENELAAVVDECVDGEEDEEEEEPNFNVDQRKEIETRLDEDRVIMRGYLLKQDKLRQWRRRWFVLRQNTLSYYADDKEYEVKQILRRPDIHDIRGPDPSTAKAKSLHRTYFKVVAAKRNYWLAHDDATKAREWFNALVQWKIPTSASAPQPATAGLMLPVAIRHSMSTQVSSDAGAKSLFPQPIQRVQSANTPPPPQQQQQALSFLGVRRKGSNVSKASNNILKGSS
ncbi:hypothetical protein EV175_005839, partial [Coemansia sp. RSA 1933]